MPQYFFNVHNGHVISDEVGMMLPGIREAQLTAMQRAADLLERKEIGVINAEWSIEVSDLDGEILFVLSFTPKDLPGLIKVAGFPRRN